MAQSIGEQLREARAKRGLTLEQASQSTHIRKNYLEALENDQREALPSAVQGRGFLRLYADLLGLPVAGLLAAWEGKPAEEVIPPPSPEVPPGEPAGQEQFGVRVSEPAPASTVPQPAFIPAEEIASQETTGSGAIFSEIGQTLRKQRESLGLSIAEVERFTRLRQHYIVALEEGRIDNLPSPVQGRGMLSNYAEFLNMDEDAVLLRFADGLQARRIERIPKPDPAAAAAKKRPARQAPFWRRFLTPDLIFGIGVAVIILFFVLWTTARITNLRGAKTAPTPPDVASMLLTPKAGLSGTPAAGTPAPASNATAAAGETAQTPTLKPTQTPVNASGQDITPEATEAAAGGGQASKNAIITLTSAPLTTPTILPVNNDPLQVYIIAHQRAFLRVDADGKLKFLGRTVPGNAYAFSGIKRVELLTGNAAALQVFYNLKDLGTLGSMGQAVGLVFADNTMMTPTPAFTATSTPTKLATITPLPTETPQATMTITPYVP